MGKLNMAYDRKIFGTNIVPKQADIAPGVAWGNLILSWDWDGWVKPQIDYMAGNAVGCNAIRMIGAAYDIAAGRFTQQFYDTRITQLLDYCASLGVYVYFCGCGKGSLTATPISNDGIANIFATTLLKAQKYSNVIGVDLVQEANVAAAPTDANLIDIIARVKAAGVALPITCSTAETNLSSAAAAPWITSMAPYFDFIDAHIYTYPVTMQTLSYLRGAFPDKDIILGEYGRAQSVAEDSRLADLKGVLDLMNSGDQYIRGGLRWASEDQDSVASNMWGAYDVSWNPRTRELNQLRRYTGGSLQAINSRVT